MGVMDQRLPHTLDGLSIEGLATRASSAFWGRYQREPTHIAVAPGRVNLIGEHTDYNGGYVLPVAIDRACIAAAAPAADPAVSRIVALDLDKVHHADLTAELAAAKRGAGGIQRGSWPSYVLGVIAQFQRRPADIPNLDMIVTSSVPLGGGLSGSAAIEVAVATLLERILGLSLDPRDKALLCRDAEHEFAGVPCGIMDQFISVMGRRGCALLIDCRSFEAAPIPMPTMLSIVIANTNVHHSLASGGYASRRRTCASAARALNVTELRDATPAMVDAATLTDDERRCARHVVSENERTLACAEALGKGDLDTVGSLMYASHESLRDDYRVSCDELDTLVELARPVRGVYGARMTGAGFGGCVVVLVHPGAVEDLTDHLTAGYQSAHDRQCAVFATTPWCGAHVLKP
jgi:galactokinase